MTDPITGAARERVVDYIGWCDNVAGQYPIGVPHGVQKDGLQNAVDARRFKKRPAIERFELVENAKGTFFTMTDENTCGLTGPVRTHDEYEEGLGEDDHWARFEGAAFTKDSTNAIGARGQGKFIFIRASTSYAMYYDTLRQDGVYRLGYTQARHAGCPVAHWEGADAEQRLREDCGLEPLTEIGTRIVIVDPSEELVEELRNGAFLKAIEETWFRAIEKRRLEITLSVDGETVMAGVPEPLPLPQHDDNVPTWVLGHDFRERELRLATGDVYRVKHLEVGYFKTAEVPEEMRGVAIVHNGMKIESLQMDAALNVRDRICGYIEFEEDLDAELRLRENQEPNHYRLHWNRRLPHAIKDYVNAELAAFGRSKLGLGSDPREARGRKRSAAEDWAMRELMRYAADLDLFGARRGVVRPPVDLPPAVPKDLWVSLNGFSWPDPSLAPRVNRGHAFPNLQVTAGNNTDEARSFALSLRVLRGDDIVLEILNRENVDLGSRERCSRGPFTIAIDDAVFEEKGEYRLKASLVDRSTGDEVDSVARHFWVEEDPPLRAPFLIQGLDGFPEPNEHREWIATGSINNSPVVYYNTAHPAYTLVEADEEAQGDYLFDLMLQAGLRYVLSRPLDEDGSPDIRPLDAATIMGDTQNVQPDDVLVKAYEEVTRYMSEVRWKRAS